MHLVNTIKYLFMSFFEFSVCIIIFNNDTISRKAVSTTGITSGGRGKNDGDSLTLFHAAMFEEHLRCFQPLIYKRTAQSFSETSLPHTHHFLFLYEGRYFLL